MRAGAAGNTRRVSPLHIGKLHLVGKHNRLLDKCHICLLWVPDDLLGAGDVPVERKPGTVDHDGTEAGADRSVDYLLKIDFLIVLVDHRDVAYMKPGESRVLDPLMFIADGLSWAGGLPD